MIKRFKNIKGESLSIEITDRMELISIEGLCSHLASYGLKYLRGEFLHEVSLGKTKLDFREWIKRREI